MIQSASAQGPHLVAAWGDAAGEGQREGSGRVNLAGMIALRRGFRTRLIYRMIAYHGRKHERTGFRERDPAGMIDAAHQQLGHAHLVLVWDNDIAHRDVAMKDLLSTRPWLAVFYLPPYTRP